MTMRRASQILITSAFLVLGAGCARNEPIQTDRAAFTYDSTYQRAGFSQPIEATFDKTAAIFRESGYVLDIVDRATGQISGRRGKTGDKGAKNQVELRFFALVMPGPNQGSQLALKFTQVASVGLPVINQAKAEIILSQPELYAYVFRRVGSPAPGAAQAATPAAAPSPIAEQSQSAINADILPDESGGTPN
ncbi:MAG: hypothetical protein ACKOXK_06935 [Chakrabartia sp.]